MSTHKNSNYDAEREKKKGVKPPHPPKSEEAKENFEKNNK